MKIITNISVMHDVSLITLDNMPNNTKIIADIFTTIADSGLNVDMISQTSPYGGVIKVSFTLSDDDISTAISILGKFKDEVPKLMVGVNSNNCKLSIYGEKMREIPGVAAKIFNILANNDIAIKVVTTSETDISYLIYEDHLVDAVNAIKEEFDM